MWNVGTAVGTDGGCTMLSCVLSCLSGLGAWRTGFGGFALTATGESGAALAGEGAVGDGPEGCCGVTCGSRAGGGLAAGLTTGEVFCCIGTSGPVVVAEAQIPEVFAPVGLKALAEPGYLEEWFPQD